MVAVQAAREDSVAMRRPSGRVVTRVSESEDGGVVGEGGVGEA